MLSQPIFDDRSLSGSFYQALMDRFLDSFDYPTQSLLSECSFGFAPSPSGVKTFLMVAPSQSLAEQLLQDVDQITHQVSVLMAGVGQLAICIFPQRDPATHSEHASRSCETAEPSHPNYMMCKFFPITVEDESSD